MKRTIEVKMRLTEDELTTLMGRMREVGMQSREAYLRKMALAGYILRIDLSEAREALRLMATATSNINQLAKRANETRSIYAPDMVQLRDEVGNLRSQVADVLRVGGKVRKLLEL